MENNEKTYKRITMEFLAKQAERIKSNICSAETQAERELWESEGKALIDNLRECYGDSAAEINFISAELERVLLKVIRQ